MGKAEGGREGGLKGAPSSPLLLCLDNIMLCVHVHNAYWVFFEAGHSDRLTYLFCFRGFATFGALRV